MEWESNKIKHFNVRCIVAGANTVRQWAADGREAARALSPLSSVRGMLAINYIICYDTVYFIEKIIAYSRLFWCMAIVVVVYRDMSLFTELYIKNMKKILD